MDFLLEGMQTNDMHVGNQTILMSGGSHRLFYYFLIMWIHIITTSLKAHRNNLSKKNYNGEILLIIPFIT